MGDSGNGSRLWVFIQYSQFVGRDKDKIVGSKNLTGTPQQVFEWGSYFWLHYFC